MDSLFTQLETLHELFILKGMAYDRLWDSYEQAEIDDVGCDNMLNMRAAILTQHDEREKLLCRMNSIKNEIVIQATRMHETCLLDFVVAKKIEYFTGS